MSDEPASVSSSFESQVFKVILSLSLLGPLVAMSALRFISSASRRAPKLLALGRRGYAEAADKIKLSLGLSPVLIDATAPAGQAGIMNAPDNQPGMFAIVQNVPGA